MYCAYFIKIKSRTNIDKQYGLKFDKKSNKNSKSCSFSILHLWKSVGTVVECRIDSALLTASSSTLLEGEIISIDIVFLFIWSSIHTHICFNFKNIFLIFNPIFVKKNKQTYKAEKCYFYYSTCITHIEKNITYQLNMLKET